MSKKLYVLFTVFVLAMLVVSPASAGISGTGISGVQVQNLTNSTATVNLDMYNQAGGASTPLVAGGVSINPLAAQNFYMPSYSLTSGAYSMVVSANQLVAAIARTDWGDTGGAAIYSTVAPATNVTIPLVFKGFGNQSSQFTIQNTDTSADATDVVITLYGRGLATAVATMPTQTIGMGASKTYQMTDAAWGVVIPDNGSGFPGVNRGFVGMVTITSSKPLVAQSFIDVAGGSRGVTGFSGVDTGSASSTLYCPLIRSNFYGDTGISIVNPNASSITVDITYTSDGNSPSKGTFTQQVVIGANSSEAVFQGPGGTSRAAGLPGGTVQSTSNPTPKNDGFYGVARLAIQGGTALAVVNDSLFGASWAVQNQSTYNCATASDAGTKFAMPLVRKDHVSNMRLTTGIQVQNTTGSPVTVNLELTNWDGTSQAASNPPALTIPAYGSGNLWQGSLTGLPTVPANQGGYGWYGSATLTATGNVVLVVNDANNTGYTKAADSANYNALKIQ